MSTSSTNLGASVGFQAVDASELTSVAGGFASFLLLAPFALGVAISGTGTGKGGDGVLKYARELAEKKGQTK